MSTEASSQIEFTDAELLLKFSEEDGKHYAFNLIVRKYQQRVYWHVRRILLDHDDSNDVVQNTFIKAWKGLENFRSDSQLFTWLYRIATNESITFLNQKKRRNLFSLTSMEEKMAHSLQQDPMFSGNQIELKLQQALLKLPAQQRLVFNMKYFDDMKYEEISQILGLSVGGLKASYHHAVKKIEKFIYGT